LLMVSKKRIKRYMRKKNKNKPAWNRQIMFPAKIYPCRRLYNIGSNL
jgi:hypothetical protein